jgi:hypothetical protein
VLNETDDFSKIVRNDISSLIRDENLRVFSRVEREREKLINRSAMTQDTASSQYSGSSSRECGLSAQKSGYENKYC